MTNAIPEISTHADAIFIIGSNTAECHPLIAMHVIKAQARGAKLIVADPRMTEMANKADIWLRVPPGYNVPLINAMLHVIIHESLHNQDFVSAHVDGFDAIAQAVQPYDPLSVSTLTGIQAEDIIAAARLYARAGKAMILYAMGVTQFTLGTGNVTSLANLAAITGQIGRPGTGVCPLRGQNNVQGACDMGCLPNTFPGYQPVTDAKNQAHFQAAWKAPLSDKVGLKLSQVPDAILDGKIHALYVFGENPAISDPQIDHFIHAMGQLDLLIAQDIFMTETARLAHIVLPASCWGEKDGTFTNTERRVQKVRQAVNPPGEARDDWRIIAEIATRMGYPGMQYRNPEEIWDEVREVVPWKYKGITYHRLDDLRGIAWPCPEEDHPGTPYLYAGGKFLTPSGKASLRPVLFQPLEAKSQDEGNQALKNPIIGGIAEPIDESHPFTLTTGRRVYHYHTGTMTRKSPVIDQIAPQERVEINPQDAKDLEIRDGDYLRIYNPRGEIAARAWVTERVPEKTVFVTFHFWEANSNELTRSDSLDPIAGIPEYKVSAVNLVKITAEEARQMLASKRQKYKVLLEYQVTEGEEVAA